MEQCKSTDPDNEFIDKSLCFIVQPSEFPKEFQWAFTPPNIIGRFKTPGHIIQLSNNTTFNPKPNHIPYKLTRLSKMKTLVF